MLKIYLTIHPLVDLPPPRAISSLVIPIKHLNHIYSLGAVSVPFPFEHLNSTTLLFSRVSSSITPYKLDSSRFHYSRSSPFSILPMNSLTFLCLPQRLLLRKYTITSGLSLARDRPTHSLEVYSVLSIRDESSPFTIMYCVKSTMICSSTSACRARSLSIGEASMLLQTCPRTPAPASTGSELAALPVCTLCGSSPAHASLRSVILLHDK